MKNIAKILLPLAFLGLSSCKTYEYKGNLYGENVSFKSYFDVYKLTVERKDGKKITYIDLGGDFKIDRILIEKDGKTICYDRDNPFWKDISVEPQKQFDKYLDTIKAINYNKVLESVKK